jgi:hypothetical protein
MNTSGIWTKKDTNHAKCSGRDSERRLILRRSHRVTISYGWWEISDRMSLPDSRAFPDSVFILVHLWLKTQWFE